MSTLCWSCQRQPAVMGDGRCQSCAGVPPQQQPTMAAPQSPPPYGGQPPQQPQPPGAPPQSPYAQQPPQPPQQQSPYPHYPQGAGPAGPAAAPPLFSSPKGLSTALTVLLIITAVASLYMAGAAGNMYSVLSDIESGDMPSLQEAEDADDMYNTASGLLSLVTIATGIVFLIWFYRTRVNAELFDPAGHRRGRGWAIGGWFVPIINLWFPKQIANDIWRASTPWGASPSLGPVTSWWVLWIVSLVTSAASLRLDTDSDFMSDDLNDMQREASMTALSALIGIAAAILAILFVRKLTSRQLTKYAQGPNPQPGYGPGPA